MASECAVECVHVPQWGANASPTVHTLTDPHPGRARRLAIYEDAGLSVGEHVAVFAKGCVVPSVAGKVHRSSTVAPGRRHTAPQRADTSSKSSFLVVSLTPPPASDALSAPTSATRPKPASLVRGDAVAAPVRVLDVLIEGVWVDTCAGPGWLSAADVQRVAEAGGLDPLRVSDNNQLSTGLLGDGDLDEVVCPGMTIRTPLFVLHNSRTAGIRLVTKRPAAAAAAPAAAAPRARPQAWAAGASQGGRAQPSRVPQHRQHTASVARVGAKVTGVAQRTVHSGVLVALPGRLRVRDEVDVQWTVRCDLGVS